MGFDSNDSLIVQFEDPPPSIEKSLMRAFADFQRTRQKCIDAGLIPDVPLPPEVYPPGFPNRDFSDADK